MAAKQIDAGLRAIDDLERAIVAAHDQKGELHGISAAEVARFRPGVVALAKKVCDQLRAEHRARRHQA